MIHFWRFPISFEIISVTRGIPNDIGNLQNVSLFVITRKLSDRIITHTGKNELHMNNIFIC
jgi:hypothetical protein